MPNYMYCGDKIATDGTGKLEVASGIIPMGQTGLLTTAEFQNLTNSYFLAVPGSAGVTVVNGPPTVQTITVYDWQGDNFVLTFGGQSTVLPSGATPTAVQAALQALSSIGAGNATVSGPAGGPYVVTYAGTLAGSIQAAIVAGGLDLSASANLGQFGYNLG